MRHALLALLSSLLFAPSSTAAVLTLTGSSLGLVVGTLPATSIAQGTDPVAVSVSSGTGGFAVPASLFQGSVQFALFAPTPTFGGSTYVTFPTFVSATNASGSVAAGGGPGGGFGGQVGLNGILRGSPVGGLINIVIPLSAAAVGVGGATAPAGAAALKITVTGHAWTAGPAVVTGVSFTSGVNTLTLSGYDARGAGHAGTVQLVSPIRILSNGLPNIPIFFIQTLHFVPEPGVGLLLLTAAAGVALRARRRPGGH